MKNNPVTFSSGVNQYDIKVWFTFHHIREKNKYTIYFRLCPPTEFYFGEIVRDDQGQPCTFNTIDEASDHGHKFILEKLMGEE